MDLFNNLVVYVFQKSWIAFLVLNLMFFYYAAKSNVSSKLMVLFFLTFNLLLASVLPDLNLIKILIVIVFGYFIAKILASLSGLGNP